MGLIFEKNVLNVQNYMKNCHFSPQFQAPLRVSAIAPVGLLPTL